MADKKLTDEEIEKLTQCPDCSQTNENINIAQIKVEAYKEFAERLKKPTSKCRLTAITEKETCSPGSELWEFWNAQEVEAELMLKSIDRVEKELTEEEE